jgi:putative photosynthetic complex assembly protein
MAQAARRAEMPKAFMLGIGLVMAGVFVLVSIPRRIPLDPATTGAVPVATRMIQFDDRADGGVDVTDAGDGSRIAVVPPGEGGFVRGTMRGLARGRMIADQGRVPPFRLSAWPDGRLTLEDTATGRVIEMTAFGQTNLEAFRRFLTAKEE